MQRLTQPPVCSKLGGYIASQEAMDQADQEAKHKTDPTDSASFAACSIGFPERHVDGANGAAEPIKSMELTRGRCTALERMKAMEPMEPMEPLEPLEPMEPMRQADTR